MDEKPDQILGHIESQRSELGRNLSELETRVRRGTDWKTYLDRNPMMMLGVALGGGLLLGTALGRRNHHRGARSHSSGVSSSALGFASAGAVSSPSNSRMMAAQRQQISQTMDHVKAALVGFGIAKAKEFMCQAIPGFDLHLSEAQQKHTSQGSDQGRFTGESGPGEQSGAWESGSYKSGGPGDSGGVSNAGSSSTGYTGYRGSHGSGEPVGSAPVATP